MPLELTPLQQQIHEGLKRIGDEISNFYIDGIRILQSDEYYSKTYLLGHIAREIDGGIRGIFASEKNVTSNSSKSDKSTKNGHIESILLSLGLSDRSEFAADWFEIANQFHGFDTPYLVEELHRLKDYGESATIANYVLDIYLKMLQVVTPDYNSKHIQDTIESIYRFGDDVFKEKCNEICNIYASRGNFILREIFSKYNPL